MIFGTNAVRDYLAALEAYIREFSHLLSAPRWTFIMTSAGFDVDGTISSWARHNPAYLALPGRPFDPDAMPAEVLEFIRTTLAGEPVALDDMRDGEFLVDADGRRVEHVDSGNIIMHPSGELFVVHGAEAIPRAKIIPVVIIDFADTHPGHLFGDHSWLRTVHLNCEREGLPAYFFISSTKLVRGEENSLPCRELVRLQVGVARRGEDRITCADARAIIDGVISEHGIPAQIDDGERDDLALELSKFAPQKVREFLVMAIGRCVHRGDSALERGHLELPVHGLR